MKCSVRTLLLCLWRAVLSKGPDLVSNLQELVEGDLKRVLTRGVVVNVQGSWGFAEGIQRGLSDRSRSVPGVFELTPRSNAPAPAYALPPSVAAAAAQRYGSAPVPSLPSAGATGSWAPSGGAPVLSPAAASPAFPTPPQGRESAVAHGAHAASPVEAPPQPPGRMSVTVTTPPAAAAVPLPAQVPDPTTEPLVFEGGVPVPPLTHRVSSLTGPLRLPSSEYCIPADLDGMSSPTHRYIQNAVQCKYTAGALIVVA